MCNSQGKPGTEANSVRFGTLFVPYSDYSALQLMEAFNVETFCTHYVNKVRVSFVCNVCILFRLSSKSSENKRDSHAR